MEADEIWLHEGSVVALPPLVMKGASAAAENTQGAAEKLHKGTAVSAAEMRPDLNEESHGMSLSPIGLAAFRMQSQEQSPCRAEGLSNAASPDPGCHAEPLGCTEPSAALLLKDVNAPRSASDDVLSRPDLAGPVQQSSSLEDSLDLPDSCSLGGAASQDHSLAPCSQGEAAVEPAIIPQGMLVTGSNADPSAAIISSAVNDPNAASIAPVSTGPVSASCLHQGSPQQQQASATFGHLSPNLFAPGSRDVRQASALEINASYGTSLHESQAHGSEEIPSAADASQSTPDLPRSALSSAFKVAFDAAVEAGNSPLRAGRAGAPVSIVPNSALIPGTANGPAPQTPVCTAIASMDAPLSQGPFSWPAASAGQPGQQPALNSTAAFPASGHASSAALPPSGAAPVFAPVPTAPFMMSGQFSLPALAAGQGPWSSAFSQSVAASPAAGSGFGGPATVTSQVDVSFGSWSGLPRMSSLSQEAPVFRVPQATPSAFDTPFAGRVSAAAPATSRPAFGFGFAFMPAGASSTALPDLGFSQSGGSIAHAAQPCVTSSALVQPARQPSAAGLPATAGFGRPQMLLSALGGPLGTSCDTSTPGMSSAVVPADPSSAFGAFSRVHHLAPPAMMSPVSSQSSPVNATPSTGGLPAARLQFASAPRSAGHVPADACFRWPGVPDHLQPVFRQPSSLAHAGTPRAAASVMPLPFGQGLASSGTPRAAASVMPSPLGHGLVSSETQSAAASMTSPGLAQSLPVSFSRPQAALPQDLNFGSTASSTGTGPALLSANAAASFGQVQSTVAALRGPIATLPAWPTFGSMPPAMAPQSTFGRALATSAPAFGMSPAPSIAVASSFTNGLATATSVPAFGVSTAPGMAVASPSAFGRTRATPALGQSQPLVPAFGMPPAPGIVAASSFGFGQTIATPAAGQSQPLVPAFGMPPAPGSAAASPLTFGQAIATSAPGQSQPLVPAFGMPPAPGSAAASPSASEQATVTPPPGLPQPSAPAFGMPYTPQSLQTSLASTAAVFGNGAALPIAGTLTAEHSVGLAQSSQAAVGVPPTTLPVLPCFSSTLPADGSFPSDPVPMLQQPTATSSAQATSVVRSQPGAPRAPANLPASGDMSSGTQHMALAGEHPEECPLPGIAFDIRPFGMSARKPVIPAFQSIYKADLTRNFPRP